MTGEDAGKGPVTLKTAVEIGAFAENGALLSVAFSLSGQGAKPARSWRNRLLLFYDAADVRCKHNSSQPAKKRFEPRNQSNRERERK